MNNKDLFENYKKLCEELRDREGELITLRRKKLEIQKRLNEIKEKSRQQILQRLDKEANEKREKLKMLENELEEKKKRKLELERSIRELNQRSSGANNI